MSSLLLTEEPLTGTHAVRRWLMAQRDVYLVADDNVEDVGTAINNACNVWGGAYHPMIPVRAGATALEGPWETLVRHTLPTRTFTRGRLPVRASTWPRDIGGYWYDGDGGGELPLSVLTTLEDNRRRRTVRTATGLSLKDPWGVAYHGILGTLPTAVDAQRLQWSGLRPDLKYSDLIEISPVSADEVGAQHLLEILRDPHFTTAASVSCVRLALAAAPLSTNLVRSKPTFPMRFDVAREVGPNLVVVYEPGSAVDLCFLWHLRAVHGLPRRMPLAVPVSADVPGALRHWWTEIAVQPFGLRETRAYLVSASVERARLEQIASSVGAQWGVLDISEVLQPSHACGIETSEIAVFTQGRARLVGVPAEVRAALGDQLVDNLYSTFEVVATPVGLDLPPSFTLATSDVRTSYRRGFVAQASSSRDSQVVEWPTGQTVLDAVLRDVDLRGEPSYSGKLAELLISRTHDFPGASGFLDPRALSLLERLATRHGLTWFKRQLRAIVQVEDAAESTGGLSDVEHRLRAIEERVSKLAGIPSEEEQLGLTFDAIKAALAADGEATRSWLRWAEDAGLVVRGVDLRCDQCTGIAWRPIADLAPPLICRGCGRAVERPYSEDALRFRYQGSELLLRLFKDDVLPHVLTFRYVTLLFRPSFDHVGPIFGAYPGVNIRRPGETDLIGEADVLFVMADGRVGVAECKANAAGLIDTELEKLRVLADAVQASWTLCATTDRAAHCGPNWRQDIGSPDRPHYVLTAEHLFEASPINALGHDPFAWRESFTASHSDKAWSDDEHHAVFVKSLRDLASWQASRDRPWWRTET